MDLDQPRGSRHEYGEIHVVGDCAFAPWTSVHDGPRGPETTMHGADFYRFSDELVAAKIAYRRNRQSWASPHHADPEADRGDRSRQHGQLGVAADRPLVTTG